MSDEFLIDDGSENGDIILSPNSNLYIDDDWSVPEVEQTPNDEFDQIVREFKVAEFLGEIARYRIWRLRKTEDWKKITDQNGGIKYSSWEDVITDLSEELHCSRQQLFERVRVYEQLFWLGYSPEEAIKMVSERPSLYNRVLSMVMDWDQRQEKPRSISIPSMHTATEEQATEYIREILNDALTFDTQKEAIKYVSETILLEPQVDFWYNGDVIYVKYFQQSVDSNGALQVEDYGSVVFYPDSELPVWAKEKLDGMFKFIGKYDANKKP